MTAFVVHADWSKDARKRWMSVAAPLGGEWRVSGEAVGCVRSLLDRLRERARPGPVALGVDAPLGMPSALQGEHVDFPSFLRSLDASDAFFQVNGLPSGISRAQPFFPLNSRSDPRRHMLLDGLGVATMASLLRECERRAGDMPAASPMFWTLGAKQVGKAAIALWRDLLLAALQSDDPPLLWPFEGDFATLLRPGRVVIAETYPANAMRRLELGFVGSKRRQDDRRRVGPRLRAVMAELGAEPDVALAADIAAGFPGGNGDDRFDSLVGVLQMLQIVRDPAKAAVPSTPNLAWEGWILGRP